ncbi:MAG TPA: hypothetical protein PK677_11265 [Acidiphilium sp.]|nr:hypothetical protein [Acidiphilium sp.]
MSSTYPIIIDGREMTVAEFQSSKNLHVGGSLYLSGTGVTALPDGLHVGGGLYLRGTGIKPIGKDKRGYEFFAVRLASGPRIIAGCRNFSPAEARAHWTEGSECRALAEACIATFEKETV